MTFTRPRPYLFGSGQLRFAFVILLFASFLLTCSQPISAAVYGGRTPGAVAAFYYPWYDVSGNDNTWRDRGNQMGSLPATLYHSGDVNVMKTQMDQASTAGIDAFAVTYNSYGGSWKDRFYALLNNAPVGFSIAAHFEISLLNGGDKNVGYVVNALRELRNNAFNNPHYFRYTGKPVIYFWRPGDIPGDLKANWNNIRNQVDPNHETIWSVDTTDFSLLDIFDTIHYFGAVHYKANIQSDLANLKQATVNWNNSHGGPRRLSTSSVAPGWDETHIAGRPQDSASFRDRAGGNYYRDSWNSAINVNPDLVTITSWNEWYETSAIEPGRDWGNLYLDITRDRVNAYKGIGLAFGDASILKVWERPDLPVYRQINSRSYTWGPVMFDQKREPYAESPGGARMVYYFDKSRMEINRPGGPLDVNDQFYVTNGLLPIELMSGKLSLGDNQRQDKPAAQIPVAGDSSNNPNTPTYAAMAKVSTYDGRNRATDRNGQLVLETLSANGTVGSNAGFTGRNVRLVKYINESGHNIAGQFCDFMNKGGPVWENNNLTNGPVVEWLFAMGYPISEPYWITSKVGGVDKTVLVQCFERRCLTYTPDNPAAFQVEMGNVGRHYHLWRYGT